MGALFCGLRYQTLPVFSFLTSLCLSLPYFTKELIFIRNAGAYMGALFGGIQLVIWSFYKSSWVLPAFGFVVGILTNWLALKMIFEPVEPVYICGMKLHGLFLQRQTEVADVCELCLGVRYLMRLCMRMCFNCVARTPVCSRPLFSFLLY
jgi:hypothetical protein